MKQASRHFEDWHRSRGLPGTDADGYTIGRSRIFMQQYDAAPDGRAVRPPHVDFWHWLLETYEHVHWRDTHRGRAKTVSLKRGMHVPQAARTPTEIDEAVAKLLDDTPCMRMRVKDHIRQDLLDRDVQHNECVAIVDRIHDIYGDDIQVLMKV